jgi:2-dehydro-3-deoxygalactonokinase
MTVMAATTGPDRGSTEPGILALDWGTTSQRAWLLDRSGAVLAARTADRGLLRTTEGIDPADAAARARAFAAAYTALCGDWHDAHPDLPAIACGMVGSAQGWIDAGYRSVPAALEPAGGELVRLEHPAGPLHVVPGVRCLSRSDRPGDVMRGEETQVLGVLGDTSDRQEMRIVVLPGTHTKWVRVAAGVITDFTTAMTGELYGLEMRHGILGRSGSATGRDDAAFARGLAAGVVSRGLAVELFAARSLMLEGLLDAAAVPDYVSGVLIADEVRTVLPRYGTAGAEVFLCGPPDLCRRYAVALDGHGVTALVVHGDVVISGLWTIAVAAGLVAPEVAGVAAPIVTTKEDR